MLLVVYLGYALWGGIYPVDVVKSKLQTDSLSKPTYRGSLSVIRDIWIKKVSRVSTRALFQPF